MKPTLIQRFGSLSIDGLLLMDALAPQIPIFLLGGIMTRATL